MKLWTELIWDCLAVAWTIENQTRRAERRWSPVKEEQNEDEEEEETEEDEETQNEETQNEEWSNDRKNDLTPKEEWSDDELQRKNQEHWSSDWMLGRRLDDLVFRFAQRRMLGLTQKNTRKKKY